MVGDSSEKLIPGKGNVIYATPEEAFAARTEWQGDCLVWTAGKRAGYGRMIVGGRATQAHRYAYEKAHGKLDPKLFVDHMCHNRSCVNVEHLRAVTQRQNTENLRGTASNNTSGYRGVAWSLRHSKWTVRVGSGRVRVHGGHYPKYELHIAAYAVRLLRNKHHTHNNCDRD